MNPAVINPELVNQVVRNLPNNALTPVRIAAAENFSNLRFPSTRDEHWKYTSLASVAALGNDWLESQVDALTPAPRTAGAEPALPDLCQAIEANWLVVRDGVVDDAAFQEFVKTLGPQISVSRLRDDVGRKPLRMDDALSSLNAALLRDGLRLTVSEKRTS